MSDSVLAGPVLTEPGGTVAVAQAAVPEPIDWSTARRVGRFVAGRDPLADSYLHDSLIVDFEAVTGEASVLVAEFTGLAADSEPHAGVVDRAGWIDANVASMRRLIGPLSAKLGARLSATPLAPIGRHATGAELGALLGYMSQRVLGQYDLLVPDEGADGISADGDRVYYLGMNVLALERRFAFRPLEFRRWIAIHELTHRAQFSGVPWLRPYFLSLVEGTLGLVETDPKVMVRAFARALEALSRGVNPFDEAGLVGLFVSTEQRALLDDVQALMSLLEGHGNHVMNALGARHVEGVERMDEVLSARREARGLSGQINKALGIQMKLRQYAVGEAFVAAVVARAGERGIDAAWSEPAALPTLAELHAQKTGSLASPVPLHRVAGGGRAARDRRASPRAPLLQRYTGLPVVVGCSGGADSLALLAMSVRTGAQVHAVHVDHGLRAGSHQEADGVATAAARLGAAAVVRRTTHVAEGPNLEARARDARYAALEASRAAIDGAAILVAHTMDDQAETVLLSLLRGSASSGLGGMPAVRGAVVRPLLGLRRAETAALCATLGLVPLDDPMNSDQRFRRAWVRHDLMPRLAAAADRDLVPVLARQAGVLRSEADFLDELARAALASAGDPPPVRALAALDPVVARRAVRLVCGSPPIGLAHVDAVLEVVHGRRLGHELPGGRRVSRRDGRLVVD